MKTSLAEIATTNNTLYRAYLLKEQLREVFRVKKQLGHGFTGTAGACHYGTTALQFPRLLTKR